MTRKLNQEIEIQALTVKVRLEDCESSDAELESLRTAEDDLRDRIASLQVELSRDSTNESLRMGLKEAREEQFKLRSMELPRAKAKYDECCSFYQAAIRYLDDLEKQRRSNEREYLESTQDEFRERFGLPSGRRNRRIATAA